MSTTVCNLNFYLPGCGATNASAPGQADGSIVVSALDSNSVATVKYNLSADFTYASGGQTSGTFSNVVPGTYTVYARNSANCRATITITVGFNTAYAELYRLDFHDLQSSGENRLWRFLIEDNQYTGSVSDVEGSGFDPVVPSWRGEGSEEIFDTNVISSQVEVKLNSRTDQEFIGLYTYDETRYRGSLYQYSAGVYTLFWQGFLTPMLYSEPYVAKTNYEVTLIFVDRLADLKEISFTDDGGNIPETRIPIFNALVYIINKTQVPLNIWETVNIYATGQLFGTNDSTLEQTYIDTDIYLNSDGTAKDCLTVLKALMDFMGTRIYQSNGRWNIDLISEKSASAVPTRKRTSNYGVLTGGDENPRILLRRKNQPAPKVNFADMSQVLSIPQSYGTIDLTFDLGIIENNILKFGQFEIEDVANGQFKGWQVDDANATNATYGVEKLREPRNGSNYAFYAQFDTSQGREYLSLYSLPIPIAAVATDYKLTINFDLYARPVFTNTYIFFDVSAKIGSKYLKPVRGATASNEFTTGGGALMDGKYFRFYIDSPLSWQSFSIDAFVDAADTISGDLVLEFRFDSNQVYDLTTIAALNTEDPTYYIYDKRRRVKAANGAGDLIYTYYLERDNALTNSSPDILRVTATSHIWRLQSTTPYPQDSATNNYESWLSSILLDNVTVQYFPDGEEPSDTVTVSEYPNPGVRQTLEKTLLHGSIPATVDANYQYIAKGIVTDSAGDPIDTGWKRRGVSEDRTLTELLGKMIRGQYEELRWKITGTLDLPDTIPTFYNTLHETRTGKIYQFMSLTLMLRSQLAEFEAMETLSGGGIVDETGSNITQPGDVPGFEPPVVAKLRSQTGYFRLTGKDLVRGNFMVAAMGSFALTGQNVTLTYDDSNHPLIFETTESVVGSPAYQCQFDNATYTKTLTTAGTASDNDVINYDGDVTVFVSRTGLSADVIDVFYYRDGVLESSVLGIAAGSTIGIGNTSYTFTGLTGNEELKVTLTEG